MNLKMKVWILFYRPSSNQSFHISNMTLARDALTFSPFGSSQCHMRLQGTFSLLRGNFRPIDCTATKKLQGISSSGPEWYHSNILAQCGDFTIYPRWIKYRVIWKVAASAVICRQLFWPLSAMFHAPSLVSKGRFQVYAEPACTESSNFGPAKSYHDLRCMLVMGKRCWRQRQNRNAVSQ